MKGLIVSRCSQRDGRIISMEAKLSEVAVTANTLDPAELDRTGQMAMRPTDTVDGNYRVISQELPRTEAEADARGQILADSSALKEDQSKVIGDKVTSLRNTLSALPSDKRAKTMADASAKTIETIARRKAAFEAMLAPKPVPFSKFKIETFAADGRLVAAAAGGPGSSHLVKGRFSDSGLDDLAVANRASNELLIVAKVHSDGDTSFKKEASVIELDASTGSAGLVAMRLNSDALSDLVVLGNGAPTVRMSLPDVTFVVNTTDDDSGGDCVTPGTTCALRRAIFLANMNIGGTTTILFNIPGAGVHTIHPLSNFPDISKQTIIDGTSQPGFAGLPLIEIEGDLMTGGHEGLKIKGSNSMVRGLGINHITSTDVGSSQVGGSGITVYSTSSFPNVTNVIVEGNFLGTDPTGSSKKGNDANGVHIYDADQCTVGGTVAAARNILSGNGNQPENKTGVGIAITGGNENHIRGNYIGTNSLGNIKLGNSYGMFFTGINNELGGVDAGAGNVISGNGSDPNGFGQCSGGGVTLDALIDISNGELVTHDNIVSGNLIGTNASGNAALGNCSAGISSLANLNTIIGSSTENGRNTISDNGYDGLWCGYSGIGFNRLSGYCFIAGNNIGTDVNGTIAIPNDQRNNPGGIFILTNTLWATPSDLDFVFIGAPGNTTPGGACTGFCNLISGNYSPNLGGGGIYRSGFGQVLIVNNTIGTNRSGTSALPNFSGIVTYNGSTTVGGPLNDGMGGTIDGGNLISGNHALGMSMQALEPGGIFEVKGNRVGVSADGIDGVGNGVGGTSSWGILVYTGPSVSAAIGGTNQFERNVVAATTSDGIGTRGDGMSIGTYGTATVVNNWIGLNGSGVPLGNSGNGIAVSGNGRTMIGGLGGNEGNVIIGNGRAGVVVSRFEHPSAGVTPAENVTIRGNGIAGNGGLGIDLVIATPSDPLPSGVTPNDCFDDDQGANGYQNYPELVTPVLNGDGTVTLPGTLRSKVANPYVIDFYQSPAADPTNYGEGSNYIGSIDVQTDGNGFAAFNFTSPNPIIPMQTTFTATATDIDGNTSEFSCAAGVCTSGTFQDLSADAPQLSCIQPIIVTVETDESDPNTADGVCDVDLVMPDLQCSLRAAIQEANARNGFDVINFDIPGGGIHTITVPIANLLPSITEKVTINGTSQPGYTDSPLIELQGEVQGSGGTLAALNIQASKVTVDALAINRFSTGILVGAGASNIDGTGIFNCYIGMNADGLTSDPSVSPQYGIAMGDRVTNSNIGRTYAGNVISNCDAAILMAGSNTQNNKIQNNKIGTDRTGNVNLMNGIGIVIGSGAKNNLVGGEIDGDGNIISGSVAHGISLGTNAESNRISGNLIGTNVDGTQVIPNGISGINIITGAKKNIIGGSFEERNVISGNGGIADPAAGWQITMDSTTTLNEVYGNYIGITKDGSAGLGGITGIGIAGQNNKIGGVQSSPNIIGSQQIAIALGTADPAAVNGNQITYNRIGTSPDGGSSGSNANNIGVLAIGNVRNTNISNNLISGNLAGGVLLRDGTINNTVSNNRIGTDASGNNSVPNGIGVAISKAQSNTISANQISGNTYVGVFIGEDFAQQNRQSWEKLDAMRLPPGNAPTLDMSTSNNLVQGNLIGTSQDGTGCQANGVTGVNVGENAMNNTIGGSRSGGKGNVISCHSSSGIYLSPIFSVTPDRFPQNNKIQGNRIGIQSSSYAALPNLNGIHIIQAANNIIGGDPATCIEGEPCDLTDLGNIIGGNTQEGIFFDGPEAADNVVGSNFVGVAPDGTAIGNGGDGVKVMHAPNITIDGNTIGNSGGNGILVDDTVLEAGAPRRHRPSGSGWFGKVTGNLIGVAKIGDIFTNAPNAIAGVKLTNVSGFLVGSEDTASPKNIISGNSGPGVSIEGVDATDNQVNQSIIGTDADGSAGLGNGGDGIEIIDAPNNVIGDPSDSLRSNTIAGNSGNGISVNGSEAHHNNLFGNAVGVIKQGVTSHQAR